MNKVYDFCNKISKKLDDHSKSLASLQKSQDELVEALTMLSENVDQDDKIPPEVSVSTLKGALYTTFLDHTIHNQKYAMENSTV